MSDATYVPLFSIFSISTKLNIFMLYDIPLYEKYFRLKIYSYYEFLYGKYSIAFSVLLYETFKMLYMQL